jgi:hypothetical protein
MLGELVGDYLWFDPMTGTVLKKTGEGECALFPPGASAVDGGFVLPCPIKQAADAINALEEES